MKKSFGVSIGVIMITRIRYTKTNLGSYSFEIPMNADLTIRVSILMDHSMVIFDSKTQQTLFAQKCPSEQRAKRAARRQLEKMGLNFNNEIRRKNG